MVSRNNGSDTFDGIFNFDPSSSWLNHMSKSRTTRASGASVAADSHQDEEFSDGFPSSIPKLDDSSLEGTYFPHDLNLMYPSLVQFDVDDSDDSMKFSRGTPLPPMPVIKCYNKRQAKVSVGAIYKSEDYTAGNGHSRSSGNHLHNGGSHKKVESVVQEDFKKMGQRSDSSVGNFVSRGDASTRPRPVSTSEGVDEKFMDSASGGSSGVGKIDKSKSKRQSRRYAAPRRSRYCHLCARHEKTVEMVGCGNINHGTCQKSICVKCIKTYNLQTNCADWECPHCQNKCPSRAKCFSYDRQTAQRREKMKRAKSLVGNERS